uniref:Uncharacterized protein n=1 Tax=Arundo donax TaxID=35708 RepID=A0A0A9E7Z7_ARUDO
MAASAPPYGGEEGFHATPRSQIRCRWRHCWSSSAQTVSQPVGEVDGSRAGQARTCGGGAGAGEGVHLSVARQSS